MSVRSKALRFAILMSVIVVASGCSVSSDISTADDQSITAQESSNEAVIGDSGEQPGSNQEALVPSAPAGLRVLESQQLLARTDSSYGLALERGSGFSRLIIDSGRQDPTFDVMTLANPSRLVLDFPGQTGARNQDMRVENDQFLAGVRIGAHNDRTRVVLDMNRTIANPDAVEHDIATDAEGRMLVTFIDSSIDSGTMATAVAPQPAQTAQLPSLAKPQQEARAAAPEEMPVSPALEAATDTAATQPALMVENVDFFKTHNSPGQVRISLNDRAAFQMKRSAPSEYVLSIPGASAAAKTTAPLIAPKTIPGMRSVRAVQRDNETLVRMFVDPGAELQAFPQGNDIIVEARQTEPVEEKAEVRAQLAEGAPAAAPAEAADDTARSNPTGILSADGSKVYTGRLISLDLQDTDIDNALRIIAEVSNLNIIASDDVSGKVTLRLIDVPWDQALDVILKTNGLDQVTEGNVIRIAPVDKLRQEREALKEAKRAAEDLEDLTVQYIRVSYARVGELKEQVEAVLSERGTVTTDERTNQLIVKDIRKGQERTIDLIKRLDLRTPQVLLETQIVEGQRNILRDLGFQWNFTYVESPETGNATGLNFPNSVVVGGNTGPDGNMVNFPAAIGETGAGSAISAVLESADGSKLLAARLSALETEGKARIVSRPQVATVNNKQAEIKSVETVRVRLPDSGTSIATGAGASASGGGRTAFEEIDVGIQLAVTPQASPDYYVLLDVNSKSSTFGTTIVDNIPSTLNREATSTILVKSGQTFALGGVYRLEDNDTLEGVPFLKDLPFLGWAFRRTKTEKSDEELIFFITPHIVEGSFDASLM